MHRHTQPFLIFNFAFLILHFFLLTCSYADYAEGDGSPEFPFQIAEPNQLIYMSQHPEHWDKHFILTADINLALADPNTFTTALIAPDTSDSSGFQGLPFTGIFDGANHTIMNLTIDTNGDPNDYLGLFGQLESVGQVRNLNLENISIAGGDDSHYLSILVGYNHYGTIINCCTTGTIIGETYSYHLGGMCGHNEAGSISNCYFTGTIIGGYKSAYLGGLCGGNSGNINNCYVTGSVTGRDDSWYLGGLCGININGSINNCYTTGVVTGGGDNSDYLGGLVGYVYEGFIRKCFTAVEVGGNDYLGGIAGCNSSSHISNCYANGSVTGEYYLGGLVGWNKSGSVSNCYANGSVTGENYLGGLVGYLDNYGSITNCYAAGYVSGNVLVGGLVGYNNSRCITGGYFLHPDDGGGPDNDLGIPLTDPNMRKQSSFVGWDFNGESANGTCEIWQMSTGGGYPVLSAFHGYLPPVLAGAGTKENPYQISDPNELGAVYHYDPSDCFRLVADIDLTGIHFSTAMIPVFFGSFDGNQHNISRLTITGSSYLGMFGIIKQGQIYNLGLIDPNISCGDDSICLASLAGLNDAGSIRNCYTTGLIHGKQNVRNIGTLVGRNHYGYISNCYANGYIIGGDNSSYIGGLVGSNSYSGISNCYSSASVWVGIDSTYIGGLVGYNRESCISGGYFLHPDDGGGPDNGYGIPLSDPNMCKQNSFVGWDFTGQSFDGTSQIWQMSAGGGYPVLSNFHGYIPPAFVGVGTAENPYQISDPNELGAIYHYDSTKCYRLTADIDLSGIYWSVAPIPSFYGSLDGNHHSITHLTITGGSYLGLFDTIYHGQIIDLELTNSNIIGGSYSYNIGGMVGYNYKASISNCFVTVNVDGGYKNSSGLVAYNDEGHISNCHISGNIDGGYEYTGGLMGYNNKGIISNCSTSGVVSGTRLTGGLLGYNNEGNISNCYNTCLVNASSDSGGLVGYNENSDIYYCYNTGSVTTLPGTNGSCIGGLVGYDWGGIINNCYTSCTVNGGGGSKFGGLVGYNRETIIYNCFATGSVNGGKNSELLGGLVGHGGGSIINCYAMGNVNGGYDSRCLGGLVGQGGGNISSSYATGSIIGSDDSDYLGGLVGYNFRNINNCYATGSVSAGDGSSRLGGLCGWNYSGDINNCYSIGSVSSGNDSEYLGGLCGYILSGDISKCYYLNTAGPDNGLGTPLTDSEMKQQSSFVNWDFVGDTNGIEDHWQLCIDGYDYPRLTWQFNSPADFLHSGRVDLYDLFVITHDWLSADSRCCDIYPPNGDDIVNLFDYIEFSRYWLKEDE